jgi:hypothetical protein
MSTWGRQDGVGNLLLELWSGQMDRMIGFLDAHSLWMILVLLSYFSDFDLHVACHLMYSLSIYA